MMAEVRDKCLYDSKIFEAIKYIKSISKKKPTLQNIHKYLVKQQLTLENDFLQVLLDVLVEENNLEIYKSNINETCYNIKKTADVIDDKDSDSDTETLTEGNSVAFYSNTPRRKSVDKSPNIRELETFIDKMDSLHKNNIKSDDFHICHQVVLQQKEYIKSQNTTIDHLRGELQNKQKVIENLLETLKSCLVSQSMRHDERYFSLQDTNYKSDQKNFSNSDIPINSHKELINIDKGTISNNHERNNHIQRSNQKTTKDDDNTTDDTSKTSSSSNQNSSSKELNISRTEHGDESTKGKNTKENNYDKESNDDQMKSNEGSKLEKKKVFILGDSIIKHVKSYNISKSVDNCKVYVKDFPGARVRCMHDYVKPTIRENPDHIILHVGTNDLSTNIPTEKVAESIVDLASSLKSSACTVAISNITVRNDRYRKKVSQVNKHLKTLCMEKNFELITHENKITERHLNGSKLHLNKRGTAILSNTFTEAISNTIH